MFVNHCNRSPLGIIGFKSLRHPLTGKIFFSGFTSTWHEIAHLFLSNYRDLNVRRSNATSLVGVERVLQPRQDSLADSKLSKLGAGSARDEVYGLAENCPTCNAITMLLVLI